MKKTFYTVALFIATLGIVRQAQAQDPKKNSRFRAGLTFGPVATDITGMDTRDTDSDFNKLGISFGALVNTRLNEKNVLQLEINYIMKGSSQQPDSNNFGYYKLGLRYLEVPILVRHTMRMNIRRKQVDKLEVEGGVSFGRLIGFSWVGEDNYQQQVDQSKLNFTDVSLFAGVSYNFTPNIYFTFRYGNSVIPVIKRNAINPNFIRYEWNNGNNQTALFAVHYVFGKDRTLKPKPSAPDSN
ncbi:MAG: porin family protein [Bacteroidia bacterium]